MPLVISAISLILVIGALVDIITRQDTQVKHMPKIVWVLLVVFLPLIGSVLWFSLGREYERSNGDRPRIPVQVSRRPRDTPGRPVATPTARVRSTEEQLADLEREIEFHEKQARIERLQRDVEERRKPD
ncbi:hypothetical protein L1277_000433 [Okibacterium sp. HSC-33S16]|uniref:PLD nuclease N-terminal domain-containing protein n=1 Tax=Okibacterium sp. HSC-33S16 TaxID=2910965 RepID=UPI0020A15DB4|nr:PLD nuclease N-terminal domain-containing protein [Okibacterium sp. HSC-33S16]MCP2030369.1 hypothetical protein [Okibacterium sp. HSC-33S16]